jgi:putative transposase
MEGVSTPKPMPFVRVWVHLIWGTTNRESIIAAVLRPKLSGHIRINAKSKDIWLDSINVVSDHAHALISLKGDQTIGKVAQLIKGESSHWVNQEKLTNFHWTSILRFP